MAKYNPKDWFGLIFEFHNKVILFFIYSYITLLNSLELNRGGAYRMAQNFATKRSKATPAARNTIKNRF